MVSKNNRIPRNSTIGQVFTPDYVAEFMVKNVISFIKNNKNYTHALKVLEPAVGEGVFLKYLIQNEFSNIFAYEMDLTLKHFLLNSFPKVNFKFDNFLGSEKSEKFDIIIGNPPYLGQNYNADVFQDYVSKYPICAKYFVGNMDLFYYFLHIGIEKLNPGGIISYITTNYWITKSQKTGIKLLKPHIINECFFLQYIDLTRLQIFEGARGQHNCIFVLQKKTEEEKLEKKNIDIQIIQIVGDNRTKRSHELFNQKIFEDLIRNNVSSFIRRYNSALSNRDLSHDKSWNLIYPQEVKSVVHKVETYCKSNGKILRLKDFFIMRNGLILINDNIFILKKGKELKIENDKWFLKVNGDYTKLSESEQSRLKKVYKSKSIQQYGYNSEDNISYIIYFNKNEFINQNPIERNRSLEQKYPTLSRYLKQYETKLREILINAKENPENFYYPRRGSFIRKLEEDGKENLVDLEPFYDGSPKIFLKYISNENIFGYSTDPYYATSDTYFLWSLAAKAIDYLFIIAYLNSKLVSFLFKAKNIHIKRSKTKLEHGLPIPHLENFKTEDKCVIIDLIKLLTFRIVNNSKNNQFKKRLEALLGKLSSIGFYSSQINYQFKEELINAFEKNDKTDLKKIIDTLFFLLFNLDKNKIDNLLNKYYP
ncbi:MAG: Eco57I restriction-modification methylase domain-containing protein [Candidatus Hodarchaeota archaeon]